MNVKSFHTEEVKHDSDHKHAIVHRVHGDLSHLSIVTFFPWNIIEARSMTEVRFIAKIDRVWFSANEINLHRDNNDVIS